MRPAFKILVTTMNLLLLTGAALDLGNRVPPPFYAASRYCISQYYSTQYYSNVHWDGLHHPDLSFRKDFMGYCLIAADQVHCWMVSGPDRPPNPLPLWEAPIFSRGRSDVLGQDLDALA